ncbi:MAG: ABC transporter permease [Actinomycetota bacterium]
MSSESRGSGSRGVGLLWRKAPLLAFRWPLIAAALAAGAAILALSTLMGPLFLSSAGTGALERELAGVARANAGFVVSQNNFFGRNPVFDPETQRIEELISGYELLTRKTRALTNAVERTSRMGAPDVIVIGTRALAAASRGATQVQVQPIARAGAEEHVEILQQVSGPGVLVAQTTARALDLEPGDQIELSVERLTTTRVKGIYRDLIETPVTEYWRSLRRLIYPAELGAGSPPPPMIAGIRAMLDLGGHMRDTGQFRWEVPIETRGLTLSQAREIARRIDGVEAQLLDEDTRLGAMFQGGFNTPATTSLLPALIASAAETAAGIESPVRTLSLAGGVVALILVAVAGGYSVQKRRIEFRLLAAMGANPISTGARVSLEALVPTLLASALGGLVALGLVTLLGPGRVDLVAVRRDLLMTMMAVIAGVLVYGSSAALTSTRALHIEGHHRGVGRFPWEAGVLFASGAALYGIVSRGALTTDPDGGSSQLDLLLVLWPILFVLGGAGLVVRGARAILPLLRSATSSSGVPVYLAVRRLAGASRSALLFVTAAAVAVGVLVYSTMLVSSVKATTNAKTHVFAGSDVSVPVSRTDDLPAIEVPHTRVLQLDRGETAGRRVDILGIDPQTFVDAAYWDQAFASDPVEELTARLGPVADDGSLPVIVAGRTAVPSIVQIAGHDVPIEHVGEARTWPGMLTDHPMIVADATALEDAISAAGGSVGTAGADANVWAKGSEERVLAALEAAGLDTQTAVTAQDAGDTSALLSISWTFTLLELLGIFAGLLAVVGMLLYLAARQRARLVSYALAKRMGLQVRNHRFAVVLELLGMLLSALATGATLGVIAVRLVYARLDLLPEVPPSPLLRTPSLELALTTVTFVVAAWGGAWWVQRSADGANVGEVMRLAD